MYQTSIRNKKIKKHLNNNYENTYNLDLETEEYAYVIKMLGNCRVNLISNSGNESIGIIRGALRKFAKRVLIEKGDIVAISKRNFQDNKVDIVHKYNRDQITILINENRLSNVLLNSYNNIKYKDDDLEVTNVLFDNNHEVDFNKLKINYETGESGESDDSDVIIENI